MKLRIAIFGLEIGHHLTTPDLKTMATAGIKEIDTDCGMWTINKEGMLLDNIGKNGVYKDAL